MVAASSWESWRREATFSAGTGPPSSRRRRMSWNIERTNTGSAAWNMSAAALALSSPARWTLPYPFLLYAAYPSSCYGPSCSCGSARGTAGMLLFACLPGSANDPRFNRVYRQEHGAADLVVPPQQPVGDGEHFAPCVAAKGR